MRDVNTLSQQQRMSHALNVRSQGQGPSGWYTWFGMTVSLSEMERFIFIRNVILQVLTSSAWRPVMIRTWVSFDLPDPTFAGYSWACILAWISSDAWGVSPTQADTRRASRTHSRSGQQSASVSFSPHKRRLLFSLSWTRTAVWVATWKQRRGKKKHWYSNHNISYKPCLTASYLCIISTLSVKTGKLLLTVRLGSYLSHLLPCEHPLCHLSHTWWRTDASCKRKHIITNQQICPTDCIITKCSHMVAFLIFFCEPLAYIYSGN